MYTIVESSGARYLNNETMWHLCHAILNPKIKNLPAVEVSTGESWQGIKWESTFMDWVHGSNDDEETGFFGDQRSVKSIDD